MTQEKFVSKRFERFTGQAPGFSKTDNSYIPADFNGDGKVDFLMFTPNNGCTGGDGDGRIDYGSRGGPPTDFVLSTPTGYQVFEGFGGWVDASMIQRRGSRDVLVFSYGYNGDCGFIRDAVWGWTGSGVDVIERRNDRGALVDREGCPAGARQDSVANAGARLAPGKLPILNGLWADSQRGGCARLNPRRADGDPAFIIDDNKMVQVQDYYELLPLQNLGSGRYRTGTELDNQTIRVIDPKNITIETGNTGSYVWCSPATEWEPWQG